MAPSGTAMLATVPRCWQCDKLSPEQYINCGEPDAFDRGCEIAKTLRARPEEVAKLNVGHPFYEAQRIILGHKFTAQEHICVAIPRDMLRLYGDEPKEPKQTGFIPAADLPFQRFELCRPETGHPKTAEEKQTAYSACSLHLRGHLYAVGCKPCNRAKKGPCGTNHIKGAECKVLEQMNAEENAAALAEFDAEGDTVGVFLYSLLKVPADLVMLPTLESIQGYRDFADRACWKKIRELLPEDMRGQLSDVEGEGEADSAEEGSGDEVGGSAGDGKGEAGFDVEPPPSRNARIATLAAAAAAAGQLAQAEDGGAEGAQGEAGVAEGANPAPPQRLAPPGLPLAGDGAIPPRGPPVPVLSPRDPRLTPAQKAAAEAAWASYRAAVAAAAAGANLAGEAEGGVAE